MYKNFALHTIVLLAASISLAQEKEKDSLVKEKLVMKIEMLNYNTNQASQEEKSKDNIVKAHEQETRPDNLKDEDLLMQKKIQTMSGKLKNQFLSLNFKTRMIALSLSLSELEVAVSEYENNGNPKRLKGPKQFDSRIEIAQLDPTVDWQVIIRNRTESVAIIVEKENLTRLSSAQFQLNVSTTLRSRYNLCDSEAFINQPVVGTGTCFIIADSIMMTAKHVFERPLKDYAVVFGYKLINKFGTAESGIAIENIYYPTKIISDYDDLDLVKFSVDRRFNRPALEWEKSAALKKGTEVYMIGYPSGLPEKLAINADIWDNANPQFFYTSLDSFQGNSGSPVFNFETHKIIGVLVSGQADYEYHGNCYTTTTCRLPFCPGEKAMRIEMAFTEE